MTGHTYALVMWLSEIFFRESKREDREREAVWKTPKHIGHNGDHCNWSSDVVDCETYPRFSRFWIAVLSAEHFPHPVCCWNTLQKFVYIIQEREIEKKKEGVYSIKG